MLRYKITTHRGQIVTLHITLNIQRLIQEINAYGKNVEQLNLVEYGLNENSWFEVEYLPQLLDLTDYIIRENYKQGPTWNTNYYLHHDRNKKLEALLKILKPHSEKLEAELETKHKESGYRSFEELTKEAIELLPSSFPLDLTKNVKKLVKVHIQTYFIENSIRLILTELEINKAWVFSICNKTKKSISGRKATQKDWIPPRGNHDVFWMTLGELIKFIETNQPVLVNSGFNQKRIQDIVSILRELSPFRNYGAHNPMLLPTDSHMKILEGLWEKFSLIMNALRQDGIIS